MMTVDAQHARKAFGARLKGERERRGTSLSAISDATKVNPSLLEALERGDASRWPKGLYRRSFFRDYLNAIGLPAEPNLSEFLALFPDGDEPPVPGQAAGAGLPVPPAPPASGPLRLTFEGGAPTGLAGRIGLPADPAAGPLPRRAAACAADLAAILLLAGVATLAPGVAFWPALAIAATLYASAGTLLLGTSPASLFLRSARLPGNAPAAAAFWRALAEKPGSTLVARSAALRSYFMQTSRFAPSREAPLQRDLAEVRRRRLEQANRNADEIEAIG